MNKPLDILVVLRQKGVNVRLDESETNLKISGNTTMLSDEEISVLRSLKDKLIQILISQKEHIPISPICSSKEKFPLSPMQKGVWMSDRMNQSEAFNIPAIYNFELSNFDRGKFQEAVIKAVLDIDVLRLIYPEENGVPYQQEVEVDIDEHLSFYDLKSERISQAEKLTRDAIQKSMSSLFTLNERPLWEILVFELPENAYRFYLKFHHLIGDAHSLELVMDKILSTYKGLPSSNEINVSYRSYVNWISKKKQFKKESDFWKSYLSDYPEYINIKQVQYPFLEAEKSYLQKKLNREMYNKLRTAAQKNRLTTAPFYTLTLTLLLSKLSGHDDVIIGVPSSGRTNAQLNSVIGMLANEIPLRVSLDYQKNYSEALREIQHNYTQVLDNQFYPLDYILEDINYLHTDGESPLFNTTLSIPNTIDLGEYVETDDDYQKQGPRQNLAISILEYSNDLILQLDFNKSKYSKEFAELLLDYFEVVLSQILEYDRSLSSIILSRREEEELSIKDNAPKCSTDHVNKLIKDQKNTAVAMIHGDKHYTYDDLQNKVEAIGWKLIANGIKPEQRVLVGLEKGVDHIATMLAIWKVGAVYVPIDLTQPEIRVNKIQEDCLPSLFITEPEIDSVDWSKRLDDEFTLINSAAYILYTSGSSGVPKGVVVSHSSLANKMEAEKVLLLNNNISPICYWLTNPMFDVSFLEHVFSLVNGGSVVIPSDVNNTSSNFNEILQSSVNILQGTPTYYGFFINEARKLKADQLQALTKQLEVFCVGGESMYSGLINEFLDVFPDSKINNHYGPTEATIDALVYPNIKTWNENIIGEPLLGTTVLIADSCYNELPNNVVGELLIGGSSLFQSYWGLPELSEKAFYVSEKGRFYKTGDLAFRGDDSMIRFQGRKDNQVKLRGYRIELEEINTALHNIAEVDAAYTKVIGEELNAWLTPERLDEKSIRASLSDRLPSYMIPTNYHFIEEFPMTPNGKIDDKQLQVNLNSEGKGSLPETPEEKELAAIWTEVLGVNQIRLSDNFFRLGGHSLKAYKMKVLIGKNVTIQTIYENPTIESLVAAIEKPKDQSSWPKPERVELDFYPLSPNQHKIWYLTNFVLGWDVSFNLGFEKVVDFEVDEEKLREAWNLLLTRHPVLKYTFVERSGEIIQLVNKEFDSEKYIVCEEEDSESQFGLEHSLKEITFDLEKGPLIKLFVKRSKEQTKIVCVGHHIILDGISLDILEQDLFSYYAAEESIMASEAPFTYGDYTTWLEKVHQSEFGRLSSEFIRKQFEAGNSSAPKWIDPASLLSEPKTGIISFALPTEDMKRMIAYSADYSAPIFPLFLTLIQHAVLEQFDMNNLLIGIVKANRTFSEFEKSIGYYLNTLPLVVKIEKDVNVDEVLTDNIAQLRKIEEYSFVQPEILGKEINVAMHVSASFQEFTEAVSTDEKHVLLKGISKYDLAFDLVKDINDQFVTTVQYSASLFSESTINEITDRLKRSITDFSSIQFLRKEAEPKKSKITFNFNNT